MFGLGCLTTKKGDSMRLHHIAILCVMATLYGCQNVWVKPGASTNEFNSDKYVCLQQSQQQSGRAVVDQYGGAASTKVVTNDYLFTTCMNARGWSLQNAERNKEDTARQQAEFNQKKANFQAGGARFGERMKAICEKNEYAPLYLKTPCKSSDINFEQITDSSKISRAQKILLPKWRTEVDELYKERNQFARENGWAFDREWADYLDASNSEVDKYNLELFGGSITWGEYNQKRKDLDARIQSEYRSRQQRASH